MGQGESLATSADPLVQRQGFRRSTGDGKPRQENPWCGPGNLGHPRGFTARVFPFHNRVSRKEAFAGLEPDAGKLSRPVLRGPAPSDGGWLLGGQARVASELSVKLGIYVSPRTVRAYWPPEPERRGHRRTSSQNWRTFVRNHAQSIVACDFLVVVTARFRTLYVFLLMEVGTRRIMHCNVTAHPMATWTLQQLREAIPSDHSYRFLLHDRDTIFSAEVDQQLKAFGLRVLRTPVRAPKANAYCERLVGSIRRECLDFMIPLGEKHLRRIVAEWVTHYNQGRPHLSLGPGIPEPPAAFLPWQGRDRHSFAQDCRVASRAVLGGLHHEYRWERIAA